MRKAGWLVGGLVFALWGLAGGGVPLAAAVEDVGPVAGVRLVWAAQRGEDVLFVYRMWTLEGPQERFMLGAMRDGGWQVESGGTWAGLEDEPEVWRMVQAVVGGGEGQGVLIPVFPHPLGGQGSSAALGKGRPPIVISACPVPVPPSTPSCRPTECLGAEAPNGSSAWNVDSPGGDVEGG